MMNSTQRSGQPTLACLPLALSLAVLAVGTFAIYCRTFSVPLLHDDLRSIAENPSIRRLWPIWPVLNPPDGAGVGGRPLLNLSFALNYAFDGTAVYGYHLVNLLIHLLAGCCLFGLVRRTLRRPILKESFRIAATPLALAVSALWTFHPVQTESVTYISQRAESLMGLFYLLTVYCFVRGEETGNRNARWMWLSLSVLACLAGAATKEAMMTAPLIVFLYDRTFTSGSFAVAWRRNWPIFLTLAVVLFPLGHRVFGLMRGDVVYGVGFGGDITLWDYGLTELRVIVRYVSLAFWPHPLVFDYGQSVPCRWAEVWPYSLALASMLVFTAVALRQMPAVGFAACWFFLILAPTSSIVPLVGESMAENRLYLPLAGIVALTVLVGFALAGRATYYVFALAAAGLAFATLQRNNDYTSEFALWRDTVAKNPDNARAHVNLGNTLLKMPGRLEEAITQYDEALHLRPGDAIAHFDLAYALATIPSRSNEAITQYEEALRLDPDFIAAHFNLGKAWLNVPGRSNDAVTQFEEAVRLNPRSAEVHFNLGNALARVPGRLDEAVVQYKEAMRLEPGLAEPHFSLAAALYALHGRSAEVEAQLVAGLRIHPNDTRARQMLADIRASTP